MPDGRVITTKVVRYVGHDVFVDGRHVGTITRYKSGTWYVLRPERYPLGARTKAEAAAMLAADVKRKAEGAEAE